MYLPKSFPAKHRSWVWYRPKAESTCYHDQATPFKFFSLTLPFLLFRLQFVRVFACFVFFSLYLTLRNENRKQPDSTFVIITHHPRRIYQWIPWDKGICRIRWYWRMFRHSYKDFPPYIHRCLQHNLVRLWCYQLGYRGM